MGVGFFPLMLPACYHYGLVDSLKQRLPKRWRSAVRGGGTHPDVSSPEARESEHKEGEEDNPFMKAIGRPFILWGERMYQRYQEQLQLPEEFNLQSPPGRRSTARRGPRPAASSTSAPIQASSRQPDSQLGSEDSLLDQTPSKASSSATSSTNFLSPAYWFPGRKSWLVSPEADDEKPDNEVHSEAALSPSLEKERRREAGRSWTTTTAQPRSTTTRLRTPSSPGPSGGKKIEKESEPFAFTSAFTNVFSTSQNAKDNGDDAGKQGITLRRRGSLGGSSGQEDEFEYIEKPAEDGKSQ